MSDQKRWATLTAKVRACVAYCCGGIGALSSLCDDNKLNIVDWLEMAYNKILKRKGASADKTWTAATGDALLGGGVIGYVKAPTWALAQQFLNDSEVLRGAFITGEFVCEVNEDGSESTKIGYLNE